MARYFGLDVNDEVRLIIPELSMATEVYDLIDSDRDHLRRYLDFVDASVDVSIQRAYFKMKMEAAAKGTDKLFLIAVKNKIVGCIDLHKIERPSNKAEIGYWIHSSYSGKNIVTQSVKTLCDYSFDVLNLNKLSLFADVENIASNKVALKAGFKLVGIKYQDNIMYDEYRDMNEYYLLTSDVTRRNE